MANIVKIERAVVSVTNKEGIVEFAKFLSEQGAEIISTGGTAKLLRENGVTVTEVSDYTGFPEMLDGRVKTLHPKIHGGILAQLDNKKHTEEMRKYEIKPINMVVVNLYDFESVYKKQGNMPLREALEQIDIGGPTLLRAAAKNFPYVVAVCDPADYPKLMEEIKRDGGVSGLTRLALAKKVFEMISKYDAMIAKFLDGALKSLKWSIGIAAEIQVGMKLA
jgi:phosphoribosylaminoimidazolecarboxamide formyltransferase/IMP cyclohydrolase